jgi:hypothetical protein
MWPQLTINLPKGFDKNEIQRKLNVIGAMYGNDKVYAEVMTSQSDEALGYTITVKDENVTKEQLQNAYDEA